LGPFVMITSHFSVSASNSKRTAKIIRHNPT
jgi:hypothetical protein